MDAMRSAIPLRFAPAERTLLGWYHAAQRICGVVICSPIGDELVRAHRTLRHFAERLSAAGFPVLRFDFHGTGDSAGNEREPERVAAWLADVGFAIDELKSLSGAPQICLAGLRLGATIATLAAAQRGGVDSLILWSPHVSGRQYVQETTRLHKMHKMLEPRSFAVEPVGYDPGGEEALGFLLTPSTIAELEKVDLQQLPAKPASKVLVVGAENVQVETPLLDKLKSLGADVSYQHMPGHRFLITSPIDAVVPEHVLEAMTSWISSAHPETGPAAQGRAPQVSETLPEQPVVFGEGLFGILSQPPPGKRSELLPPVIMLNAGTVHRVGPHRFYVNAARRLVGMGFTVFRVDLSGIGDSPAAEGCEENLAYPRDGVAEVQRAMDALEQRLGAKKFILFGLCSGADLVFQTGLKDTRVAGATMLNPRTFCVHDLQLVEEYRRVRMSDESLLKSELLSAKKWMRALTGDVDIPHAFARLAPKIVEAVERRARGVFSRGGPNDVPAVLRTMAQRGVDTLLVTSERDPGIDYVEQHFPKEMKALATLDNYTRLEVKGTDHTFTSLYAQGLVLDKVTAHLASKHLPR
jgi:alpha-beta hydrolase superfamily lysophospholipase